jgi:superfamily II DNA or RNA helicase
MFMPVPFQRVAIDAIAARFKRYKRVLLQSATGSGKTVMAVIFIYEWMAANPDKNVLCLFNLQCLLPQFEESFRYHGMRDDVAVFHDLITRAKDNSRLTDHQKAPGRRIMLTMPETFAGAMKNEGSKDLALDQNWLDNVGLILIDEAHKGTSGNFQYIRDNIDAVVLGLTATPMRVKNKEGECLVNDWEYELVTTISIAELIELRRLVEPLYYKLDEDAHLFREWQEAVAKHSQDDNNKQTIWFCRDTSHSKEWEAKLLEVGETCAVITSVDSEQYDTTGQTPNQRAAIFKDFEDQKITHLISVNALCEGFDAPIAKYCVIDRRIGNQALYQQILGRVLRPYPGKDRGHIIDRCRNWDRHEDIEEYIWDLEAEAQNSVVVKLDDARVISKEKMDRATKVMVRCETHRCPSVYNAKTNMGCPHCNKEHGLEVETSAVVWLKHKFPDMSAKVHVNLIRLVSRAIAGNLKDVADLCRSIDFIFDETGAISEEYKTLYAIAALKPKTEKDLNKKIRCAA